MVAKDDHLSHSGLDTPPQTHVRGRSLQEAVCDLGLVADEADRVLVAVGAVQQPEAVIPKAVDLGLRAALPGCVPRVGRRDPGVFLGVLLHPHLAPHKVVDGQRAKDGRPVVCPVVWWRV